MPASMVAKRNFGNRSSTPEAQRLATGSMVAASEGRGKGIASGRDMEGDRQARVLDRRPQRIEMGQVVVDVVAVVGAPDRLARQGQALEAEFGQALDLGDRA